MKGPTADLFVVLCRAELNQEPVSEYRFDPHRRWRFDYAFVEDQIAVEVEGGVYIKGRHTRGTGFIRDMEKYNRATVLGWKVLRYTPQQIAEGIAVDDVKAILQE